MRIRVGNIGGRCENCGCEDFQPAQPEDGAGHEFACFHCGALTTRRELLAQIAAETVRRAERVLEHSRKQ
jgi:hypothetical protein